MVNGKPVYDIGGGKSDFGGETRQMMPPYMTDGENSAERFIANMDNGGDKGKERGITALSDKSDKADESDQPDQSDQSDQSDKSDKSDQSDKVK